MDRKSHAKTFLLHVDVNHISYLRLNLLTVFYAQLCSMNVLRGLPAPTRSKLDALRSLPLLL